MDICSYPRLEQSAISPQQHPAFKFQPQREMKTCQEDTNHHHTPTHHKQTKQKSKKKKKRQIFPNTHQAPKTNDHLRNKSPKLSDKAKTSQHFLLDRKSDHTQKYPSCRLGSKHWPSQEFLLCQGLHPLERSILSLSELHKGFPLG